MTNRRATDLTIGITWLASGIITWIVCSTISVGSKSSFSPLLAIVKVCGGFAAVIGCALLLAPLAFRLLDLWSKDADIVRFPTHRKH